MGIIKEMTDKKISKLYLYIKSANLQKYFGTKMDTQEKEIKRAELIRNIMES